MNKKHVWPMVLVAIILMIVSAAVAGDHSAQTKYLPRQISNLYLGMPYKEFKVLRNVFPTEENEEANALFDFRTELTEFLEDSEVNPITYYFAKDGGESLYEAIIEYNDNIHVRELALAKYGPPNYKTEWRFDSGEGFGIMIWTYKNRLIIAGTIKGTEWEKGKSDATPAK